MNERGEIRGPVRSDLMMLSRSIAGPSEVRMSENVRKPLTVGVAENVMSVVRCSLAWEIRGMRSRLH